MLAAVEEFSHGEQADDITLAVAEVGSADLSVSRRIQVRSSPQPDDDLPASLPAHLA